MQIGQWNVFSELFLKFLNRISIFPPTKWCNAVFINFKRETVNLFELHSTKVEVMINAHLGLFHVLVQRKTNPNPNNILFVITIMCLNLSMNVHAARTSPNGPQCWFQMKEKKSLRSLLTINIQLCFSFTFNVGIKNHRLVHFLSELSISLWISFFFIFVD